MGSGTIDAALDCIARGWAIFPVAPNKKIPLTGHGFKDASKDPSKIKAWWGRYPEANIGIATGLVSGIAVVDVDVKKKARGRESIKLIKGITPMTFTVETPSRGWHLYYKIKAPVRSRTGFMDGIDIKSDGGYIVGPGSSINGKKYERVVAQEPADMSPMLAQQINSLAVAYEPPSQTSQQRKSDVQISVGPGNWHFPVLKQVARLVSQGYSDQDILSMTEKYTLPGWGVDQTRREVSLMIWGARRKGFDRK